MSSRIVLSSCFCQKNVESVDCENLRIMLLVLECLLLLVVPFFFFFFLEIYSKIVLQTVYYDLLLRYPTCEFSSKANVVPRYKTYKLCYKTITHIRELLILVGLRKSGGMSRYNKEYSTNLFTTLNPYL